jgi:hypothetical protein
MKKNRRDSGSLDQKTLQQGQCFALPNDSKHQNKNKKQKQKQRNKTKLKISFTFTSHHKFYQMNPLF